ncbi:MAG: endonuclease V [Phycisphaerae bacterium]|nr:endonuclease V [Phycisphaerae bacterium]MCZ2399555.1 endonuclease V [Phycisphaerae bacterium]
MRFARLHYWPRTPARAIALQRALAPRVRLRPPARPARLLAGVDVAFPPDGGTVVAGVVLWDAQTRCVIEHQVARVPCRFPYVPGLLSFRELPAVLRALRRLRSPPDAVLCDAQGLAHPRRFGLACHLGLWLNVPTVGCAKSRLIGEHVEPGQRRGSAAPLLLDGAPVGVVLRTRDGVRPLFVSPGHLCDTAWAERVTLLAATRYRLPEPTRLAHQLVTRSRRLPENALPQG